MVRSLSFKKSLFYAGVAALLPMGWNACGTKSYTSNTFGSNGEYLCTVAPDISNCDPNDESLKSVSESTQVTSNREVDVLFVVDNSGSMSEEQVGIGNKIDGFMQKIKDLDWQIAITTTDPRVTTKGPDNVNRPWGDGQFRPFDSMTGSEMILRHSSYSSTSGLQNAQQKLSNAIQMGLAGSGDERGIYATYRALQRSAESSPNAQRQFFRPYSKLAVVVISDEDECSNGNCSNEPEKSVPQNLVNYVEQLFGGDKVFSFNSLVLVQGCSTGGNIGNTYMNLSRLTGGIISPVCASDFSEPLSSLGQRVLELVDSVTLSCPAVDVTKDGRPDVAIFQNGRLIDIEYSVSGKTLSFAEPLEEGSYDLKFFCKQ